MRCYAIHYTVGRHCVAMVTRFGKEYLERKARKTLEISEMAVSWVWLLADSRGIFVYGIFVYDYVETTE